MNGRRYTMKNGKLIRSYRKQVIEGYTDGVVSMYENDKTNVSSFGAVKNPQSIDNLELVVKLRFNIKTSRDIDIEFAEAHGRTLSMKVVTPICKAVESLQYAVIGNTLYTAYKVDYDDVEKEMYLYLEEVRKL